MGCGWVVDGAIADPTQEVDLDGMRVSCGRPVDAHGTVTAVPGAVFIVSLTTDKSRVKAMGVQNTSFVLPDNKAWWSAPQVFFFCFT